jgi:hypothetical protein
MFLFDLVVPYLVRQRILQNLFAYDVTKVDMVLGTFLDPGERKYYLNPIRDLVCNVDEVQAFETYGLRSLLIGNDTSALQ